MSLVVGVTLGLLSGFLQGRIDTVIMTVVDVTLSFPQLLLALAFVAALGPSLSTIIVVLGLTGWERYTRVVRAEVLALREKDFVEAARAMGASPIRTLLHVAETRPLEQELLARHTHALRRFLKDDADDLAPEERRHRGDEEIALPFREEIAGIERHSRGRNRRRPEVDRLLHAFLRRQTSAD